MPPILQEMGEELAMHIYGLSQAKALARAAIKRSAPKKQKLDFPEGPERKPSPLTRQKSVSGAKLSTTLLTLALLALCSSVEARPGEILSRNGVYFREGAQVNIGDSYWTIVTDLETGLVRQEVVKLIARITTDTWYTAKGTAKGVLPTMKERVVENHDQATSRLNEALVRYDTLVSALEPLSADGIWKQRAKRSPLEIVGSTASWLFGLATTEDIALLNQKLTTSNTRTKQMLHFVADQATIVNESLWETRRTAKTLQHVVKELD